VLRRQSREGPHEIGFDSLGDHHDYGCHVIDSVDDCRAARRMVILASVPEMVVR